MRPLPAVQRITARIIVRSSRGAISRMSLVRTWSTACGTRQIVGRRRRCLLLRLRTRRLAICFGVLRCWQRLTVRAVHGRGLADAAPNGVGRHKGLGLSRDGREDAVLVEAHAIGASAIVCRLESRASYLSDCERRERQELTTSLPCVSCNSGRQWQFAVGEQVAGDVGSCRQEVVVGLGMGRAAVVLDSIHEGREDGGAAAGVGGDDGRPCRHEGPEVVVQGEEGERW